MKKVSRRVEAALVLACAALIALVFATGVLGKQKTWGYMEYLNLSFKQGTPLLSLDEGAEYGIQNSGPGFNLARGTYRFKYWVDTDGTGELLFKAGNSAAIEPSSIVLGPGQTASETIELKLLDDVSDLQILVRFDTGTYMNVFEVRLYGQTYTDNAFSLAFLLAGACLLFLLWQHGVLTPQGCGRLVLIGAAVLVVSAPVLKENYSAGHDYKYHMARIVNLADGLRSGQFPVRAGGFTYNGYGAITSAFYPDLFLYPFALMLLAGASIEYVMSVLTIAASVLAAATMYACAKRIYGGEWAATCASVLYVGASYRVANIMVRCAVGESLAMGFLPLFVLGLWEVIFGDKRRWRMLAFGAFAVFMCHMISTLLCATLALGLGAVCLPRILREKRMGAILKAIGATALLSLFFLGAQRTGIVSLWDLLVQFLLPCNVSCCICFSCLYSKRFSSETFSLVLCGVWTALWESLLLREPVYLAVSPALWGALLAASFAFLGWSIFKGQRSWSKTWEVKPIWN